MHFTSIIFLALVALARADFPLDFDEPVFRSDDDPTVYRIPEDLDPIHIDIEITPYFNATGNKEAWTFDGHVVLTVRVSK